MNPPRHYMTRPSAELFEKSGWVCDPDCDGCEIERLRKIANAAKDWYDVRWGFNRTLSVPRSIDALDKVLEPHIGYNHNGEPV